MCECQIRSKNDLMSCSERFQLFSSAQGENIDIFHAEFTYQTENWHFIVDLTAESAQNLLKHGT